MIHNPKLTAEQYDVCFRKGTEPPGSGKYLRTTDPGNYHCVNCGQRLFASDTKYDSEMAWPSFWDMATPGAVKFLPDTSLGMIRTEVQCSRCSAHLGHVFDDGPTETTGKHYCINSLALDFRPSPNPPLK